MTLRDLLWTINLHQLITVVILPNNSDKGIVRIVENQTVSMSRYVIQGKYKELLNKKVDMILTTGNTIEITLLFV